MQDVPAYSPSNPAALAETNAEVRVSFVRLPVTRRVLEKVDDACEIIPPAKVDSKVEVAENLGAEIKFAYSPPDKVEVADEVPTNEAALKGLSSVIWTALPIHDPAESRKHPAVRVMPFANVEVASPLMVVVAVDPIARCLL